MSGCHSRAGSQTGSLRRPSISSERSQQSFDQQFGQGILHFPKWPSDLLVEPESEIYRDEPVYVNVQQAPKLAIKSQPTPMLAAVAGGCELDSRSVERIVEHSALPDRDMLPHSPLIRNEKNRLTNGHQRPFPVNSPNQYQSGASSSSSTERAGSYHMAAGRTGDSLCGSEHYTDSGIHHADSNQLEDDHRLIHDEREHRHLLAQEQQFGTFGRPSTMLNQNRSNMVTGNHYDSRLAMAAAPRHSEESLQPIFQSSNTFPTKRKPSSNQSLKKPDSIRPFCPDWRCVLMCNMIIMGLLVAVFLVGYFLVWPAYVMPLVNASRPIDGSWTKFQPWSTCSVTCGDGGIQTRRRFCGNPAPEDGGLDCIGNATESRACRAELDCPDCSRKCPVGSGTLNADCTKCTCEHHEIQGIVQDTEGNPIFEAGIYKLGHYDQLAKTDRAGKFRLTKICAEGDNALTITKTGFSPETLIPDKTSDTTANGEMKLKKLYQPKITEIPENKVRFENQTVTLCCDATDNSNKSLQIKWYKDSQLIPPGELYTQKDPSLRIKSVKISDSGVFQCHAINRAGIDLSPAVTLEVKNEAEETCPENPAEEFQELPRDCKGKEDEPISRVNIGKCVGFDGAKESKCLHRDQFREIIAKQCKDPASNYCCGPVEQENFKVKCTALGSSSTYELPITKTLKCGCTKC